MTSAELAHFEAEKAAPSIPSNAPPMPTQKRPAAPKPPGERKKGRPPGPAKEPKPRKTGETTYKRKMIAPKAGPKTEKQMLKQAQKVSVAKQRCDVVGFPGGMSNLFGMASAPAASDLFSFKNGQQFTQQQHKSFLQQLNQMQPPSLQKRSDSTISSASTICDPLPTIDLFDVEKQQAQLINAFMFPEAPQPKPSNATADAVLQKSVQNSPPAMMRTQTAVKPLKPSLVFGGVPELIGSTPGLIPIQPPQQIVQPTKPTTASQKLQKFQQKQQQLFMQQQFQLQQQFQYQMQQMKQQEFIQQQILFQQQRQAQLNQPNTPMQPQEFTKPAGGQSTALSATANKQEMAEEFAKMTGFKDPFQEDYWSEYFGFPLHHTFTSGKQVMFYASPGQVSQGNKAGLVQLQSGEVLTPLPNLSKILFDGQH
ncbi:hypothetical protein HDU98_009626 [Podochytrium sp. JEL0797]|nr:hypothetical protein HDU98_009626 [Podochytrium sp. JEL0797]